MLPLKILKISRKHDFVFKNKDLTVPSPKPSSISDTSVTGSKSLVIKTSLFKPKSNQQFDSIKSFRYYPVVAYAMCHSFQKEWIHGQSLHIEHIIQSNLSQQMYQNSIIQSFLDILKSKYSEILMILKQKLWNDFRFWMQNSQCYI